MGACVARAQKLTILAQYQKSFQKVSEGVLQKVEK